MVLVAGAEAEDGAAPVFESDSFETRYELILVSLQLVKKSPAASRGIRRKRQCAAMWMVAIYGLTANFKPFRSNKAGRPAP